MNRLLLTAALLLSTLAFANAHHHSSGGGGSSSGSGSSPDFEKEGACLAWAPADAGVDGGVDGGVDALEAAEAADAGHPGEVCTEHAKVFGCSVGEGAPLLFASLALLRRRRSDQ